MYRSWVELRRLREIFGHPILNHEFLSIMNKRWVDLMSQWRMNSQKLLDGLGAPESYMVATLPMRRQRVIEINKSTGLPRGGLPMVTLFTEKGPVND
jgi:hypothetical protein